MRSVKSFDDSREVYELLNNGRLGNSITVDSNSAFSGYFSTIPGQNLVLFRDETGLKLRDNETDTIFVVNDLLKATHSDDGRFCILSLYQNNKKVFETRYLPKRRVSDLETYYDLTQHSREQDDFGKFIRNIIEEPGRKYRVFQ